MVKVKDVMRRAVYTVDSNIDMATVAKIMTDNRIGSVVVLKDSKPIGIVTDSDLISLIAGGKDPKKVLIKNLRDKKFVTVSPEEDLFKVVRMMVKNGYKRMPVVKDGNLCGIISDKEVMVTTPEMIKVLSEKIKARVELVSPPSRTISGLCENCEEYSDRIKNIGGKWLCEDCRD